MHAFLRPPPLFLVVYQAAAATVGSVIILLVNALYPLPWQIIAVALVVASLVLRRILINWVATVVNERAIRNINTSKGMV